MDHILIHYEPQKKEIRTIAIPLADDSRSLSEHFGDAPYFYITAVRERDNALLSEAYHRNPFAGEEKAKGIKVSEWLLKMGIDTVYTSKGFKGKGPAYVFSDSGVDVIVTKDKGLEEIKKHELNKAE